MDQLTDGAAWQVLRRNDRGVVALAQEGHAYGLPIFYATDDRRFYFLSHPGVKDAYLAATAQACLTVTEFEDNDTWRSAQAFGPVEKITLSDDAMEALDALQKIPLPPEFGIDAYGNPRRSSTRMYLWMLTPVRVSGRASHMGARPPSLARPGPLRQPS